MWDVLKLFFDTFENYITVPIIIFIICLIFKAPVKKAFMSAVLIGGRVKGHGVYHKCIWFGAVGAGE